MKPSQKICLVSNTAWSFTRFRVDLLKALVDSGYDVLLLAPEDEYVGKLLSLGVRFKAISNLSGKGMNPVKDLLLYKELRRLYRQERPDVVIHYTIKPNVYGTWAANSLGIPAIAVVTGLGYAFIAGGVISRIAAQLYRFALKKAKQVWFLNHDDLTFFIRHKLVDLDKTLQIPGEGVNVTDTFNPDLVEQTAEQKADVTFLFIGRLLYDKGIREFVAAARVIKQRFTGVNFQILGYLNVDNPAAVSETELRSWVNEGVVSYLGSVTDVRYPINLADCVVLPSYREGMSTTLQESAAMAKPLIASNICGCKEVIDNGITGFLCRVKDVGSLISCMERFLTLSTVQRHEMGEKGRHKMINEFSVDRVIQHYLHTLDKLI